MGITPLERLRAIAAAGESLAPVHSALGTVVDHAEPGHVRAHVPGLPMGELRGVGPIPVLADLVLSGAVSTNLPAGAFVTTLTMHVTTLGPLPPAGAPLHASGRLISADPDNAVSSAEIDDGAGRTVAVLTSRCAIVGEPSRNDRPAHERRPVPAPFSVLALRAGRATADPATANSGGAVQGGVLAAVAAHALDEAIGAVRSGLAGALCDLEVTFVRGIPADGAHFTVRAEVLHAGSRFASARAELRDGRGRLAVVASASQWRGRRDVMIAGTGT
ncbi:MAG: hypothetical protein J0I49_29660 [Pseudonocardia sp.]|uniref:PaaI family thioesterase n=1 Tax=Pseudonocardia sp. TaxID=60912 RepID=UPI001ACB03F4|nr:acyl-CoA thioesterase domain-containing protein [Pseudonocardia sp.]MBN9102233.1 hypothetical protein [Pseudonocardia sp.]